MKNQMLFIILALLSPLCVLGMEKGRSDADQTKFNDANLISSFDITDSQALTFLDKVAAGKNIDRELETKRFDRNVYMVAYSIAKNHDHTKLVNQLANFLAQYTSRGKSLFQY